MVRLKTKPRPDFAEEIANASKRLSQQLEDNVNICAKMAIASGIITVGSIIAAKVTATAGALVVAVLSGIVFIMSLVDLVEDSVNLHTLKHNIAMCSA